MDNDPLFARISTLFDVGQLKVARVMIAGCGSGGSQVALQLTMAGISNFDLSDHDILEVENVIRHACGRRYLGQRKVDAVADILLDRNPNLTITKNHIDLTSDPNLAARVRESDVVVIATDNEQTRYLLNQMCVENGVPFVVGRVFTRGIGGEVYRYLPKQSGCLACLERLLERTQYRDGVREIDLASEDEREKMYGLEIAEIKDSPGLNVDIAFIAAFHTRFVLDALVHTMADPPKFLAPIEHDYVVWGNRPVHPFKKHFELQRISLTPQIGCLVCGTERSA